MTASALYTGLVSHRRTRPAVHALRYRVFMVLLDLDEAACLNRRLRLFRMDRRGVLSFHQKDHGDGSAGGLRAWVDGHLVSAGLAAGGAIRVFCMPRVLGYAFNPLTVFFCHAPDGKLQATVYEVNNTFGQRHAYVLPVGGRQDIVAQECDKAFHVSPFMDMGLRYRFRIIPPHEDVSIGIQVLDGQGIILAASFSGDRQALTDRAVLREILAMPLQGAKVVAGIHWEAAKLWLKGMKLRPAPPLPAHPVSISLAPTTTTVTP
jgi:DUF1365 family protein